jgi:GTP-binding protein
LAFLIDLSDHDFLAAYPVLRRELELFDKTLSVKKHLLIGTKSDLEESSGRCEELKESFPDEEVIAVSAFTLTNIESLRKRFADIAG